MRRIFTGLVSSAAAVMVGAAAALLGVGSAATAAAQTVAADGTSGKFCSYLAPTDVMVCADDLSAHAKAEADLLGANYARASSVLVATFFDDPNYSSAKGFIRWYLGAACTGSSSDVDGSWTSLGVWANRISSYQTHSTCLVKLFQTSTYGGATYGWAPTSATVGSLNNQANSVRFT